MRHRNYLLAVLSVVAVFNGIDNVALGLVLQDIKREFALSDVQLGLLTGFAFSLCYALAGLAIARWADRGDRVAIVALTAAVWSVLVAACGFATNFVQLLLLRVGVGVGEAGYFPASQSLIADYFDRAERPRATALFLMTAGVTYVVGWGVGGWLANSYGWRVMFMTLGLPGLAVAALSWFTLKEPRVERLRNSEVMRWWLAPASRSLRGTHVEASSQPRLKATAVMLWSSVTLRHMLIFWLAYGFLWVGLGRWLPTFFVRNHGLTAAEVGSWFAVVYGVAGTLGPIFGGAWASRYAVKNESLQLRAAGIAVGGLAIVSPLIYLVPDYRLGLGLLFLQQVVLGTFEGPFWALMQALVPESMRAAATAILLLMNSLIGGGLGALTTGALSDALRVQYGDESLRYASLVLCPGFLWAAWHMWRASQSVTRDLAAIQEHDDRRDTARAACASSTVSV